MEPEERAFHDSMKPSWGPDGTLVYAAPPAMATGNTSLRSRNRDDLLVLQKRSIVSESRDVKFANFSLEVSPKSTYLVDENANARSPRASFLISSNR